MPFRRYSRSSRIDGGNAIGISRASSAIWRAVRDGTIAYSESVLQEGERLDTIAGKVYGDGRYWWVIAAASGIGWGIQVPPGTVIIIPDINQVAEYVG